MTQHDGTDQYVEAPTGRVKQKGRECGSRAASGHVGGKLSIMVVIEYSKGSPSQYLFPYQTIHNCSLLFNADL